MDQWHPLFVELLRPLVQGYYDVETNVPVGDLPREADIVLLRRTGTGHPPFQGLWRHLTAWNVLEFKGPTVRPRRQHLDLLVEIGLGVGRRLNQEREQQKQRPLPPAEVSFWYLADVPGQRFVQFAERGLVAFGEVEAGLWRGEVLGHPVFIVRAEALPVDADSLPFHLIGKRTPEVATAMGQLFVSHEELWQGCGEWLKLYYHTVWRHMIAMGKSTSKVPAFVLKRLLSDLDFGEVVKAMGPERVYKSLDKKTMVQTVGVDDFVDLLSPEDQQRLLKRLQQR